MQWERPARLFARRALLADGWANDVRIDIGADGAIAAIAADTPPEKGVKPLDLLLPGMANLHSHAFQRAMAGLTERAAGTDKNHFWGWRETMYRFAGTLSPEQIEAIARTLYIELLKHGYTAVGEFHYLHHDTGGRPYADPAELSHRIVAAAKDTGIHLTHLPVLYQTANVNGANALPEQRRFLHSTESYLALLETLRKRYGKTEGVTLGVAPHSLRAVPSEALEQMLEALPGLGLGDCPIHIHAAEQEKEVADCLSWSDQRPVEWLLNHVPVDARWCLVHATHMTQEETKRLAHSGAVAGLCPTTEADLGDGIFPGEAYLKAGGRLGIGTDSQVCLNPFAELRQLEYAQRLSLQRRTVLAEPATPSVGRTLYAKAAAGGAQALGLNGGAIAAGKRADLVAIAPDDPLFDGRDGDQCLDTLIFASLRYRITDVLVAGRHVIEEGRHRLDE